MVAITDGRFKLCDIMLDCHALFYFRNKDFVSESIRDNVLSCGYAVSYKVIPLNLVDFFRFAFG